MVATRLKAKELRHFRDRVQKVDAGNECGIMFDGFDDLRLGDIIEAIDVVAQPRKLSVAQGYRSYQ